MISQLEVDRDNLTRQLARRQNQLDACTGQLDGLQKKVRELQGKLDKVSDVMRVASRQCTVIIFNHLIL